MASAENRRGRAGLLTLHRVPNYGSVLQAYATQRILTNLGLEVTTLDYRRPDQQLHNRLSGVYTSWGSSSVGRWIYRITQRGYIRRSEAVFSDFVGRNLRLSEPAASCDELGRVSRDVDLLVVGSDQVWNRHLNIGGTEPFVLDFAPPDSTKIAIAASIGRGHWSSEDEQFFKARLRGFRWMSVRERSAQALLAGIGIDSTVVADPTLLPDEGEWSRMADAPARTGRYVLVYCLHGERRVQEEARRLARHYGADVVSVVSYWNRPSLERGVVRLPSVTEFLGLIKNAAHVVTDSFHGTCFSSNFSTPVTVVPAKGHSIRLTDFLAEIGAMDRCLDDATYAPTASARRQTQIAGRLSELRLASLEVITEGVTKSIM